MLERRSLHLFLRDVTAPDLPCLKITSPDNEDVPSDPPTNISNPNNKDNFTCSKDSFPNPNNKDNFTCSKDSFPNLNSKDNFTCSKDSFPNLNTKDNFTCSKDNFKDNFDPNFDVASEAMDAITRCLDMDEDLLDLDDIDDLYNNSRLPTLDQCGTEDIHAGECIQLLMGSYTEKKSTLKLYT